MAHFGKRSLESEILKTSGVLSSEVWGAVIEPKFKK
jgi:hypothetical protein